MALQKPDGPVLWAGLLAPVVGVVGMVLAMLTAPSFAPLEQGLSHLGIADGIASLFFNGGVILTGFVAFPFGIFIALTTETAWERRGVAAIWVSVFSMFLLGFFPMDSYLIHLGLGLSFFVLMTVGFYFYGAGNVLAGDVRHGLVTIALGVIHETAWLVWGATFFRGFDGQLLRAPGILLPEVVGIAVLIVWAYRVAVGPRADEWSAIGPDQEPDEPGPEHRSDAG